MKKIVLPLLETERLFLVPWYLGLASDMLKFASNSEVAIPAEWKLHKNIKQAEKTIVDFVLKDKAEWAIILKEDFTNKLPKAIGSIGIDKAKLKGFDKSMVVGYLLDQENWGKGICAEATRKIMHYVFVGLKIDALCASHRIANQRSKRVIEKCGFKCYGVSPRSKPNDPKSKKLYSITRDEFSKLNNYADCVYENDIYRIKYQHNSSKEYINSIKYKKQPTEYQCGQACVAMLAGVTPNEVAKVMFEEYGTSDEDIDKALTYYRIPHDNIRKCITPDINLPEICIVSMALPGYGHWSLYYKGKYYDPEFGILDECPPNAQIEYYWEIYRDDNSKLRSSFSIDIPPKSIYSKDNPIRKIDSITYVKEPTGSLCGQSCIAMLANVPVEEVINVIGTDKGTVKQDLKKGLDHYGINYAPRSTRFDPDAPLPNLCIIRMKLPGYGHWGIYYEGTYYDPEFGVLDKCPSEARIFQVWEIYQ